jgi:hypothetical protein
MMSFPGFPYPAAKANGEPEHFVGYKQPQPEVNTEMNQTEQPKQMRLKEFLKMVDVMLSQDNRIALKAEFLTCPGLKADAENIYLTACGLSNFVTRVNKVSIKGYMKDLKHAAKHADPFVFFVPGYSSDKNIEKQTPVTVTAENMRDLFMGKLSEHVTLHGLYHWLNLFDAYTGKLVNVSFNLNAIKQTAGHKTLQISGMQVINKNTPNAANVETIIQNGGSAEFFKKRVVLTNLNPIEPISTYIVNDGGEYLTYGNLDVLRVNGKIGDVPSQQDGMPWLNSPHAPFHAGPYPQPMNFPFVHLHVPQFDPAKAMGFPGMQAQPLMQRPFTFQGEFGQKPTDLKNCIHVVFNDVNAPAIVLQLTSDDSDNAYAMITHFLKKNVLKSYTVYGDDGQITQQVTVS